MTPSQIIADTAKSLARAREVTITSEKSGEREIHQKASESHKPNLSGKTRVFFLPPNVR